MIAHEDDRPAALEILRIKVEATCIFDLRETASLAAMGIDAADAAGSWQEEARAGETPRSWTVRDRLVKAGANGVIDPSRKRPGLWHLVLFRWNSGDAPIVQLLNSQT